MEKIRICSTKNPDGSIQKGSGIELDMNGPTANLLQGLTTPLFSNPITGEIAGVLTFPEETNGECMKGILISPAGASGPPEHYHPNYGEMFTIVEGAFIFLYNKEEILLKAGDNLSVKANEPHTFRAADKYAVNTFVVVVRPPGLLTELVKTLYGLAHEGKLNKKGEPGFLQAMALAKRLSEDTVFTKPPPMVQKIMASFFAPIASLMGYQAIYPEYIDDSFWLKRVEQFVQEPAFGKTKQMKTA
ncbi:MAG: cupin domain-containing protein [Bacteroidetes bacterium]|nr:MAG: cupin domain-containing protein [Bacteroidota bacterium]